MDFRFPLEPAGGEERKSGGEWKSADIERKTVTLIYPYPFGMGKNFNLFRKKLFFQISIMCKLVAFSAKLT
jgi:hypothetical protein